jgi:hypothetical protein
MLNIKTKSPFIAAEYSSAYFVTTDEPEAVYSHSETDFARPVFITPNMTSCITTNKLGKVL